MSPAHGSAIFSVGVRSGRFPRRPLLTVIERQAGGMPAACTFVTVGEGDVGREHVSRSVWGEERRPSLRLHVTRSRRTLALVGPDGVSRSSMRC